MPEKDLVISPEVAVRQMLRFVTPTFEALDCWLWGGHVNASGYPLAFAGAPFPRLAHRVVFSVMVGPIPDGLHVDHLCRAKRCVCPWHLDAVTRSEHYQRHKQEPGKLWKQMVVFHRERRVRVLEVIETSSSAPRNPLVTDRQERSLAGKTGVIPSVPTTTTISGNHYLERETQKTDTMPSVDDLYRERFRL